MTKTCGKRGYGARLRLYGYAVEGNTKRHMFYGAHRRGNHAVTAAVTAVCPDDSGNDYGSTAERLISMNEKRNRKSELLRIRAREGVTPCVFLPLEGCSGQCGFDDGKTCTLLAEVPAGEDPQDWHARMMADARAFLEGR